MIRGGNPLPSPLFPLTARLTELKEPALLLRGMIGVVGLLIVVCYFSGNPTFVRDSEASRLLWFHRPLIRVDSNICPLLPPPSTSSSEAGGASAEQLCQGGAAAQVSAVNCIIRSASKDLIARSKSLSSVARGPGYGIMVV